MKADHESEARELEWRAFRYVAGEMTADEASAIESEMATDQTVREAVSRAVARALQLTRAGPLPEIAKSESDLSERQSVAQSWRGRLLVCGGMATAASVAFLLGVYWARQGAVDQRAVPPELAHAGQPDAAIDADAWLQLHRMEGTADQVGRSWDEWEADETDSFETNRGPVVPAWLVELANANKSKGKP